MGTLKVNGDLTLTDTSSSRIPTLTFVRGTNSDTYTDWRIQANGGNLYFQHTFNEEDWITSIQLNEETQGGTITTPYSITATGGFNGNATSASKWANTRTLTLTGDTNGSVSFDGSGNMTLTSKIREVGLVNGFQTSFRTSIKGNSAMGPFISVIRSESAISGYTSAYGTGLAFGRQDTHGYIYLNYSTNQIFVGAGSGDALQWVKQLSFSDHTHNYLPLSGGTMSGHIILPANASMVQLQGVTSNYTAPIQWFKGGVSQATYNPQIGHHNTGDINGAMILLPYATESSPWEGSVGLYLSKTNLKFNGSQVLTASNYSSYALPLSGGTIAATTSTGTPLSIKSGDVDAYIRFENKNGTILGYYGINANKQPVFYQNGDKVILHSGNYNSYALPLTGGSLSGGLEIWGGALYLGSSIHLKMYYNGNYQTVIHNHDNGNISIRPIGGSLYLGYESESDIYCRKGNWKNIDAGNYSAYALPLSGGTMTKNTWNNYSNRTNATIDFGYFTNAQPSGTYYRPWMAGVIAHSAVGYGNTVVLGQFSDHYTKVGFYIGHSWDGKNSDTFHKFYRDGHFYTPRPVTSNYGSSFPSDPHAGEIFYKI